MRINKRTPRSELVRQAILVKGIELEEAIAKVADFDQSTVRLALARYGLLSSRAVAEDGEIDFELARGSDTPVQLKDKFLTYLESGCLPIIEAAYDEIDEMDKPFDKALAPEEPPEDADPK